MPRGTSLIFFRFDYRLETFRETATYSGRERASSIMFFKPGVLVVPLSDVKKIVEAYKK